MIGRVAVLALALTACSGATPTAPKLTDAVAYQLTGPYVADSAGGHLTMTFTLAAPGDSLRGDGAAEDGSGHFTVALWQNDAQVPTWAGTIRRDAAPEMEIELQGEQEDTPSATLLTTITFHGGLIQQFTLHSVQ